MDDREQFETVFNAHVLTIDANGEYEKQYINDCFAGWQACAKQKDKEIADKIGFENAEFYNTLRLLINSINNAGCEDRRSQQIDLIRNKMYEIVDKYGSYLP